MTRDHPANAAAVTSTPDPAGLCIALLGRFAVWLGQFEVPTTAFPRRKALHLLKLIALQPGHQLHRDQALDLLWPHLTPRAATAQLYKTIHHVRQAFAAVAPACSPETLLELRHEVIRLTAPAGVHTDVATFEQLAQDALRTGELRLLQQAVACYKGDLLSDDRYEEWTLTRRDALQERFIELLVALGRRWQDTGYLAEAADAFRQALARDAAHEAAHQGLMWVYALQGTRTRALRQYQRCVDLLAQELGVEPSLETTTLYEQILHEQVQPIRPPHDLPIVNLPLLSPFVGRQPERHVLDRFLERLEYGQGGVLLLEGSAGIGKTRLAQELLSTETRRWQVLWGSAYEQEGQSPYAPVIEALRKAIRVDPTDAHLLPAELALAIPELPATSVPVMTADRVAAQSALFAGMLRFLAAHAQRTPLILILDDLHASDAGTWKLFHYLARQAATMPLLLVAIRRTDEPGTALGLDHIVSTLERQNLLHRLTLTALSLEEHHFLLEQTLEGGSIDPRLADELYRLSAGNPLFAKELVRQLATDQKIALVENTWRYTGKTDTIGGPPMLPIPTSVQMLLSNRLALLTPAALRLLQFAAVAEQEIPVSLLEEWSRLGEHRVLEPSLLDVLDQAVAVGLLQERGFSYCFTHPLFRAIIYQQMSLARRRVLHAQVAIGLERAFQKDAVALPVEALAYHYLQAGDVERAAHYLILAGDRAESVFDHDSALHHYGKPLHCSTSNSPRVPNGRAPRSTSASATYSAPSAT
ncbi:ATP-binding protein [Kallotenue papyrolyticum]|uniref:ATP-binding protein n=1 Tax=Kallotenue papyrolyticum TaxID=1325125 RepID=UPI0004B43D70|nr:AAA family ATPase [Kallotenue papyrolyticum]